MIITTKGCEFYLNGVKLPFLHIDDLHGTKFGQELTKEQVSRIMLTAIKKAEVKNNDAARQINA